MVLLEEIKRRTKKKQSAVNICEGINVECSRLCEAINHGKKLAIATHNSIRFLLSPEIQLNLLADETRSRLTLGKALRKFIKEEGEK